MRFIFHLYLFIRRIRQVPIATFLPQNKTQNTNDQKMDGATDKLQYTGDHYGGVLIDADALPGDLVVFGQMLEGMPCTRFES